MKKASAIDRPMAKRVAALTFLFGLAAHAFRYFSTSNSHDSTMVFQNEAQGQIAFGRFLQPVYLLLRGQLCAPWLIGLFSLTWLAAAIYLVIKLLGLRTHGSIALTCGILSTNAVLALANATYIPWTDMYTMALLCSVLAVHLCRTRRFGFLLGAIPLCFSLALYQSYIESAILLFLILLARDCFDKTEARAIVVRGLKALATLLLGLVLYYISLQVVLRLTGIGLANSYNGLSELGDYTQASIPELLVKTYIFPGKYFVLPNTFHPVFAAVLNVALILFAGVSLIQIVRARRLPPQNIGLLALIIALMPLGMDIVYFLAKGLKHVLMSYSFNFVYVFVFLILEHKFALEEQIEVAHVNVQKARLASAARTAAVFAAALLILNNVVYANQLYLKKDLEYQATLSIMTRVIDRMEQTEGYVVDQTPVAIIGKLSNSKLSASRQGFEGLEAVGMHGNFSVTYSQTYRNFINGILGYPALLIADREEIARYGERADIRAMPAFPDVGSCRVIDGVLFVKFS